MTGSTTEFRPPIKGLISNSLIEWEGKISSAIFLAGCNFRCPFCHSPDLVERSDLEVIPFSALADTVKRAEGWVDGVVISGGEPTTYRDLESLILRIRALGVGIKLDTNGSNPELLSELIDSSLIQAVSMDVKAPLTPEKYRAATGTWADVDAIRESILALVRSDIEYEFRTTVCPELHSHEDILQIAAELRGARRYVLQIFRPARCLDPAFERVASPPREELVALASRARKFVPGCSVRGEPTPEVQGSRSK